MQSEQDRERALNRRAYTEVEAATYCGVSRSTLRQGRMNGPRRNRMRLPIHIRVGRKILYLKDDLDRWLEEHRVGDAL